MEEVAEVDESLVVLVSDISHGIFRPFAEKHPMRYFNLGICEPSIVNLASGLNHVGLNPVVHTIAPFLIERAFEQIKLDFGYQKKSVNLVSVGGAFDYSKLGCSHHSSSDVALISQIEGSKIFLPANEVEFEHLFLQSFRAPGIKYFRLSEFSHAFPPSSSIIVGCALHAREGDDVTIVSTGARLDSALSSARELSTRGISADVFHVHTLDPFDFEAIRNSVTRTRRIVSVEELGSRGGLYSRCIESIAGIPGVESHQLAIFGFQHGYGSYVDRCREARVDARAINEAVLSICLPHATER
jgi:transketolase